jgi:hypothetical protein
MWLCKNSCTRSLQLALSCLGIAIASSKSTESVNVVRYAGAAAYGPLRRVSRRISLSLESFRVVAALGCAYSKDLRDRNLSSNWDAREDHTDRLEIANVCQCRDCRRAVDLRSWEINALIMWVETMLCRRHSL